MSTIELIVALILLMPMVLAAVSLLLMVLWSWIGGHVSFPRVVVKPRSRPTEEVYRERRGYILDFVAYAAITVLCLYLLWGTLGTGYPRDYLDATVAFYVAKIKMLLNRFSFYTPSWYFGYELLRFYPPLSTLIPYVLIRLTGNVELTYYAISLAAYVMFCLGVYKFVREYLDSFPAGLYAGLVWAVVHVNFISFQGHYWETCRLFGTCVLPWTLLAVHRALDTSRRRDVIASAALLAYAGLSNILSLIDVAVFLVPFVAVKAVLAVYGGRETFEKRFGEIIKSTLLIGLCFLAMVAWWYIPAVFPYGVGRYFYGRGAPPGILDVLFSLRPPSFMPAVQLPVTLVGILGVLAVLLKRESRGVTLLTFFVLITGMVYVIQFQSVRFILLIGLSLTMLGGYFVANMPEVFSKITGGMLDKLIGWVDSYVRSVFGRIGLSLGRGTGRILVLTLVSLCVAAPIVAYYAPTYRGMAVVDHTVYSSDEYLTATWLWQHAGTSYRVYVMYGDYYRGSQWINTFYPDLMQVLGGYDQGALTDEPFVFDNLVKWGTDASQLHDMAVEYHVKYIVVEKTWGKWTDESWRKFLDERYFREAAEFQRTVIYEVVGVEPISPEELEASYTWRIIGIAASSLLAAIYVAISGLRPEQFLKGLKLGMVSVRKPIKVSRFRFPGEFRLQPLVELASVLAFTVAVSYFTGALIGFPKGFDAYNHLTRVKYLTTYWPNHVWNYQWDCGVPFFGGSYPPLAYYIAALLVWTTRCSPEFALKFLALASICLNNVSIYLMLRDVTGNKEVSFLAVALITLSPGYWSWWLGEGTYSAVISLGLMGLSMYLATLVGRNPKSTATKVALALSLSGALMVHMISAIPAAIFVLVYLLCRLRIVEGLKVILQLLLMSVCLSLSYVTQILFSNPVAPKNILYVYPPADVKNLFLPVSGYSIHPGIVAPLLVLAAAILAIPSLRERVNGRVYPVLTASMVLSAVIAAYSFAGYVGIPTVIGLEPCSYLSILAVGLCIILAVLLNAVSRERLKVLVYAYIAATLVVGGLVSIPCVKWSTLYYPPADEMRPLLLVSDNVANLEYRIEPDTTGISLWLNYLSQVPQSQGYYCQGIPYPDWKYWKTVSIWDMKDNYGETAFVMDWHAIRWLISTKADKEKFLTSDDYVLLGQVDCLTWFEYLNVSKILTATNTPTLLFIGSESSYDFFLRAIALSNFNSEHIIPVRGHSKYIDDYTLEELQKFDCIFLYGYNYRDPGTAFSLFSDYVSSGGSVFFEANGSPDYNSATLPEPFPVGDTVATSLGMEWDFTVERNSITAGIDFSKFSPPVYEGGPWAFSTTTAVRSWANYTVSTAGNPIIVSGEYGRGRVVWSGMNLVYHIIYYRNTEESKFLGRIIEWLAGLAGLEPEYEAEFINPQKRVVRVYSEAKGVLFKENYFKQWSAKAVYADGSQQRLKIYLAGPGLMYIPIPENVSLPLEIVLTYHKLPQERVGDIISLTSLVGLTVLVFLRFKIGGAKFWRRLKGIT